MFATDWTAIGAIGTLSASVLTLAVVMLTVSMARSAQRSADAAVEEAAGAWRPAVLPWSVEASYPGTSDLASIKVDVKNYGNGPALNGQVQVTSDGPDENIIPLSVAPAGSTATLGGFPVPASAKECQVVISYDDLGGRRHVVRANVQLRRPATAPKGQTAQTLGYLRRVVAEDPTRSQSSRARRPSATNPCATDRAQVWTAFDAAMNEDSANDVADQG